MKKSKRALARFLVLLVATATATLAYGDSDEKSGVERAIEYRESVMTVFSWNMKPMGAMVKGKAPYDQAVFARHAQDLATAASLDLMPGFPEDSDTGESDALPDIWLDFDDFKQKFENLQTASRQLSQTATGGNPDQIKAAFADVGKACKACHEAYKN